MLRNKIPEAEVEKLREIITSMEGHVNQMIHYLKNLGTILAPEVHEEIRQYREGIAAHTVRIDAVRSILADQPISHYAYTKLMMMEIFNQNSYVRDYQNIIESNDSSPKISSTNPLEKKVEKQTGDSNQKNIAENEGVGTHGPGKKARIAKTKEAKFRIFTPPVYSDEFAVDKSETTAQQWQTRKDPQVHFSIPMKKKHHPAQQPVTRDIKRHIDSSMNDEFGSSTNVQDWQDREYKKH